MFAFDFDHLNVFIMLILALVTFRGYQAQTLAIESQYEEEMVEEQRKQGGIEGEVRGGEVEQGSQRFENEQNTVVNQVLNEKADAQNQPPMSSLISIQTVEIVSSSSPQAMNEQKPVYPVVQLQKEYEQDSTLLNRNSQLQSESQLSQNLSSDSLPDDCQNPDSHTNESARQKRKRIHKEKRRAKKNLRKQQNQTQNQVNSTPIQQIIVIE